MNYDIYFDFIDSYSPTGFKNIKTDDPIVQKMEELMENNGQYLSVIECGTVDFLYTSSGSLPLIGVEAKELNPSHYLEVTYPDDIQMLEWARIQFFRIEQELFKNKGGAGLFSYPIRMKNSAGEYHNFLGQDYLFYCDAPEPQVYALQIGTEIDWCNKKVFDAHRYIGNDISLFRYPDEELLQNRLLYSKRELEIIMLIESGLDSNEIADKLGLSPYTVNKHRSNILEKSDCLTIMDLIYKLKKEGFIN